MSPEDAVTQTTSTRRKRKQQHVKIIRQKGQPRKYVSQHFSSTKTIATRGRKSSHDDGEFAENLASRQSPSKDGHPDTNLPQCHVVKDATFKPATACPRIFFGLRVDDLSSDSDLSDIPQDIGSDPFFSDDDALPPTVYRAIAARKQRKQKPVRRLPIEKKSKRHPAKRSSATSPYFPTVQHAYRPQFLATLPFPPLSHGRFGLMQERLAHDPYRLLLATIFLNKTPGMRAMPIFYNLMDRYPSPQALSEANVADVTAIIHELGFQNQRARKCVELAKVWVRQPPIKGKRYRKLHYPKKGDGKDVKEGEVIDDADSRVAWEISHLPGLGPYSHDSWRMFCRDEIRKMAKDWLGTEATVVNFEPEWKRVLPTDKELRAWMTWMWLKEGWIWNKETGARTKADDDLIKLANGGGIVQESADQEHLVIQAAQDLTAQAETKIETPAGDFLPRC